MGPWVDLYYQTLQDYVGRGWFVGKDQNIMNTLCTEGHAHCILVDPLKYMWENPWVGMWLMPAQTARVSGVQAEKH